MSNVSQIVIEVDSKGAITALNQLDSAGNKVGQGFTKIKPAPLEEVSKSSEKARQSMQLLSNITGVQMPRALENILAKTPGVSSALNAAFSATIVATLAKEIVSAIDQLTGFSAALQKIGDQGKAVLDSVSQANKILIGPQTLKQVDDRILSTTKNVAALGQQLGLTGEAFNDALTRGLTRYSAANSGLLETYDRQKTTLDELFVEQAKLIDEQRRTEPVEVLKLQNQARLEGLQGIAKINEQERGSTQVIKAEIAARITTEKRGQAQISEAHKAGVAQRRLYAQQEDDATRQLAQQSLLTYVHGSDAIKETYRDQVEELKVQLDRKLISQQTYNERSLSYEIIRDNALKELQRQATEDTIKAEEDASVAILPSWQRSYAQIAKDAQDRLREIQRAL